LRFSVIITFNNVAITGFQEEYDLYTALTLELATHLPMMTSESRREVVAEPESTNLDPMEKEQAPTERESTSIDNIMQIDPVSLVNKLQLMDVGPV